MVGKFGLFEEIFDFLRVVVVALATDSLHLANLTSSSRSLNVLEMHLWVLAKIDNRAQVVIKTCKVSRSMVLWKEPKHEEATLEALVRLEHFNKLDRSKNVGILRRDLNNDLEVLADVYSEHLLQAGHRLFRGETTEVSHQPLIHKTR